MKRCARRGGEKATDVHHRGIMNGSERSDFFLVLGLVWAPRAALLLSVQGGTFSFSPLYVFLEIRGGIFRGYLERIQFSAGSYDCVTFRCWCVVVASLFDIYRRVCIILAWIWTTNDAIVNVALEMCVLGRIYSGV